MDNRLERCPGRRVFLMFVLVLTMGLLPVAGWAQQEAAVLGQVTDESGGVLPGVTVTATSPALQVPSVTDVTNERGEYRLTPSPIGTYTVEYSLSGFQTLRRADIRLTVGFQSRVDVQLKVGALAETVTVSGATPVVDVTTTITRTQLTRETLEAVPTGRNGLPALMLQAPGTRPQLDWSPVTGNPTFKTFGQLGESWSAMEEVVTTGPKTGTQGGNDWDYNSIEESSVQTVGNNAESPTHGVQINVILKSGGNQFHGGGYVSGTGHQFESNNIDAKLISQGITASSGGVNTRYEVSADLGGRLVPDKFWFYGSARRTYTENRVLGAYQCDPKSVTIPCTTGPGAYSTNPQYFLTTKLSYQLNDANKLVGFVHYNRQGGISGAGLTASWDSRIFSPRQTTVSKIGWQAVKGNKFFSLQTGAWIWNIVRFCYSNNPSTLEQLNTANFTTGCNNNYDIDSFEGRNHTKGTFSWYKADWLGGNHDFKLGFEFAAAHADRRISDRAPNPNGPSGFPTVDVGNYQLIYRSGVPFQIAVYNNSYLYDHAEGEPKDLTHYLPIYFQDSWTVGRRLTLNLGVRYAHEAGFIPAQCRLASRAPFESVYPAQCWDEIDYRTWNPVVPRLHAAYDLSGDGKTVIKGGWGRFAHNWHSDELQIANQNVHLVTRFLWHAPVGSTVFTPGQSNLDLNGPDFVNQSLFTGSEDGLAGAVPNLSIKEPMTNEYNISIERQLMRNFAVRATGIYSDVQNFRLQNNLRPYSAYNIPIVSPIPGTNGVVPASNPYGTITWYEYPRSLQGRAFQQPMLVNSPGLEKYTSFEIAASKRLDRRWLMNASYSMSHAIVPFWQNTAGSTDFTAVGLQVYLATLDPNAEINTHYDVWEWTGRINGAYTLPWDVQVSAAYEARSGQPWARSASFTAPGQPIPSIVLRVEPIGAEQLPTIRLLHFRVEKRLNLAKGQRLDLRWNIFNLTNINTAQTVTQQSGSIYGVPTSILAPRLMDFGVNYTF